MEEFPMYRFVITGGPCGGKTTAISELQRFLSECGFRVFVVPEAATLLLVHGATPSDFASAECQKAFQQFVINTQLQLEESYANYGRACKQKCVLLCDRGIMDGAAYVSKEVWASVLAEKEMDTISAREGRYNAVFHLVTAANGAATHYTLENNDARHETAEEAVLADNNTQAAWHGHPHHIVVDNRNGRSFEQKIGYLKSVMASYVGMPTERTRACHKYKLTTAPDITQFPDHTEVFEVEKTMLGEVVEWDESAPPPTTDTVLYSCVRKRSQGEFHAYGLTTVKLLTCGQTVQTKRILTPQMYSTLLATKQDTKRHVVKQRRHCFRSEHQSFHVSQWVEPHAHAGTWFVVVQCESEPKIPDYLSVGPELHSLTSSGKEYSFSEMSLKSE